jgi:hypothetical protein
MIFIHSKLSIVDVDEEKELILLEIPANWETFKFWQYKMDRPSDVFLWEIQIRIGNLLVEIMKLFYFKICP